MQDGTSPRSRLLMGVVAVALVVVCVLLGLLAGAFVATRVFPSGGMGWDQIANTLGGLMIGSGAGLVIGLILALALSHLVRIWAAAAVLAGIAVTIVLLNIVPAPKRAAPQRVELPPPPVESFSLILAVENPAPDLPWRHLRISSNLAIDYIKHETPQLCVAPQALRSDAGIARGRALRAALASLPAQLDCEECLDCPSASLTWWLDQARSSLDFDLTCWRGSTTLAPVREAIAHIVADHDVSGLVCEPAAL